MGLVLPSGTGVRLQEKGWFCMYLETKSRPQKLETLKTMYYYKSEFS